MKVLIIDPTKVHFGDDRGAIHADAAEIVDVNKDVARTLTVANRALYIDPKDDPFKDRRFTASEDMLKAAKNLARAKAAAAKAAADKSAGTGENGEGGTTKDGDPPAA